MTVALATAGGCADDSAGAGGGTEGSSTGDAASSSGPATTVMMSTAADSGSGGGSGDMGMEDTSTGAPPVMVTLSGDVADLVPPSVPIPDAVISVFGDDTLTATSNAGGLYEIGPFEPETWATMIVEPSTDYQGAIIPIRINSEPMQEDQLAQISRMTIDDQIAGLESQMPAPVEPDTAVIVVRLITPLVIADGGPVTVTRDPAPDPDTFYAPDASFAPALNSNELAFAGLPVVVYFNVAPDEPGAYSFTYEHDTTTCESVYDVVPTMADHITLVSVSCE